MPAAAQISSDTPVVWNSGDIGRCTLAEFFAANEDGIDADEQAEITSQLSQGLTYRGGGGAAAEWLLSVDKPVTELRPHARDNPPWCFCGDRNSLDFGRVFATEGLNGGLVLWFDRKCTQHAATHFRGSAVGAEVEIAGRLFDVVRLVSGPEAA